MRKKDSLNLSECNEDVCLKDCYTEPLVENRFKVGYLFIPINSINKIEISKKDVNNSNFNLGGCLILSENINEHILDNITLKNIIKNILFPNQNSINGITLDNRFKSIFRSEDGNLFSEKSITIEILDVDNDTLRDVAIELCKNYKQEEVIIRFYDNSPIEHTVIIK